MEPVTVGLLIAGMLMSAGSLGVGIYHAEDLTRRSQDRATAEAAAAEQRAIEFARQQELKAEAQLNAAMRRTNPYGSNTADRLE